MTKLIFAAALMATTAFAGAASADDMRAQAPWGGSQNHQNYPGYNDGGLGRYCPTGLYPHSFPGGEGIRCQNADGYFVGAPL